MLGHLELHDEKGIDTRLHKIGNSGRMFVNRSVHPIMQNERLQILPPQSCHHERI